MRRREFIIVVVAVAAWPLTGWAQRSAKVHRIGILSGASLSAPANAHLRHAFVEALRERGWVEGDNLAIEARATEGKAERFPELAAALVALNVDVIVATNSQAVSAARQTTGTTPIVMLDVSHPVEAGFVASLARPGGNVTGLTNQLKDINGKHYALLREIKPDLERMAVLFTPSNIGSALGVRDQQDGVAKQLGTSVLAVPVDSPADVETAFATIAREQAQVLQVHPTPVINIARARIVTLSIEYRVPTITAFKAFVRDGMLMSYGPDQADSWRRAASYVDRILKGVAPADLPVEQPTKFELVINLKTAKALGLTLPNSLLTRADEVIE